MPPTEDPHPAIADPSVRIPPTPENGCTKPCHALARYATTTPKRRTTPTDSRITDAQPAELRRLIGVTIGL